MKVIKLVALLLLLWANLPAQQNFFNVPSSDITPKKKLFFQQQFNLVKDDFVSNTTVDFGLGHNFEVGVNANGLLFNKYDRLVENKASEPYGPFFCVNAQKRFQVNERWALGLGTQLGVLPDKPSTKGEYFYLNSVYDNEEIGLKLVSGLYSISDEFVGKESRSGLALSNPMLHNLGLQMGFEKKLLSDKLSLQADFISGKHALGEVVLGGAYFLTKHWVLSCGYQAPTFKSTSVRSAVLEITYVPS